MHIHSHSSTRMHKQLFLAFLITCVLASFEYLGGQHTNSLALTADAAHIFLDGFAVLLAWLAVTLGQKHPSVKNICTLLNALFLVVTSCLIAWDTVPSLLHPQPIIAKQTLQIAIVSLILNVFILQRLTHGKHDDNIRAVTLHVLGDMISSIGVIISSAFVLLSGLNRLDSLVAVGVSIYLMSNGWTLMGKLLSASTQKKRLS